MTERLLVFGGAYGNLQATQALFEVAAELGLGASRIVCTGDLAAYCADPQQTVDLVRDQGVQAVMGNCEESLAADSDDCGCGFEEDSKCSLLPREWYAYCRSRLSADAKQWMGGLPKSLKVEFGGKALLVVHGSLTAISEFVFPSTNGTFKKDQLAASSGDGILAATAKSRSPNCTAGNYGSTAGLSECRPMTEPPGSGTLFCNLHRMGSRQPSVLWTTTMKLLLRCACKGWITAMRTVWCQVCGQVLTSCPILSAKGRESP